MIKEETTQKDQEFIIKCQQCQEETILDIQTIKELIEYYQ